MSFAKLVASKLKKMTDQQVTEISRRMANFDGVETHSTLQSYLFDLFGISEVYSFAFPALYDVLIVELMKSLASAAYQREVDRNGIPLNSKLPEIQELSLIGKGAQGSVYRFVYLNKVFALKQSDTSSDRNREAALREFEFLRLVTHYENIITIDYDLTLKINKLFNQNEFIYFVLEYASCGSLYSMICSGQYHDLAVLNWMMGGALALEYIESCGIIHGDINSKNILLDDNLDIKLADFGNACLVSSATNTQLHNFTVRYTAPEIWENGMISHSTKVDIFALGLLMWELVNKISNWLEVSAPDVKTNDEAEVFVCFGGRPANTLRTPRRLFGLMEKCWDSLPQNRPTAREVKGELETFRPSFS